MTRLREQITTPTPLERAFAYTADFSNIQDWDPGVAESTQIGEGPVGQGTRFEVLLAFGARRIPTVYTITEFDRPNRVVLVGEGSALTAVDEITFEPRNGETVVTYTADLQWKGAMRFVAPLMGSILTQVGRNAVEGLAAALRSGRP